MEPQFPQRWTGTLGQPAIGEFRNGRGEFHDQEDFNGRAIFVRFLVIPIDEDTIRFEQAFSDHGSKRQEASWIATDMRVK